VAVAVAVAVVVAVVVVVVVVCAGKLQCTQNKSVVCEFYNI
jgi:hypothetical protein